MQTNGVLGGYDDRMVARFQIEWGLPPLPAGGLEKPPPGCITPIPPPLRSLFREAVKKAPPWTVAGRSGGAESCGRQGFNCHCRL